MRKIKLIGLILLGGVLVGIVGYLIFSYLKPKSAGIFIESDPNSTVYVNGEQVGRTPYRQTLKPSEISIKMVPDSFEKPLAPYETKVTLVPGIETVIRRVFGETVETSGGEVLSFEKIGRDQIGLAVVTLPDSAQVLIDGKDRVFAPYNTTDISAGDHDLLFDANGYQERDVKVKAYMGYRLTLVVNLIPSSAQPTPTPTPEPSDQKKDMVEILSTPVGFLRVRSDPSTTSTEIGQAKPGSQYVYLDTDQKSGWYKIQFDSNNVGWVSNQYAKIVKAGAGTITPSPSASLTPTKKLTPTIKPTIKTTPALITPTLTPTPTVKAY